MLHMSLERMNIEFIGMEGYMSESMHDLLAEASESLSDSGSNEVGHHPLREYLMENLPDGHENDGNGEATPLASPNNNDRMGGGALHRGCGSTCCETSRGRLTRPGTSWSGSAPRSNMSSPTRGAACPRALTPKRRVNTPLWNSL